MEEKFIAAFAECLEIDAESLSTATYFKELPEWDSLTLLNVMAMLEDEFAFQISRPQLDQANTLQDLLSLIEKAG
jgi:acyl carrier protein